MSKDTYIKTIDENIKWLLSNTSDSLERRHIVDVLKWSINNIYSDKEKKYTKDLEEFMIQTAILLNCLPSFADPHPKEGNSHIIKKLSELMDKA